MESQDLTSSRHSLDVMATLQEVEAEEELRRRSGEVPPTVLFVP